MSVACVMEHGFQSDGVGRLQIKQQKSCSFELHPKSQTKTFGVFL
jgi:hypothetical protein